MHQLSNDLVVLSARLIREVRRNNQDVPAASMRMLSLLDEVGPSTVSALAGADRCTQPTMTGLVNGLVDKGWAERTPHPADARATLVGLTADGRRTLTRIRRHNANLVARLIAGSGHDAEDLAVAVDVLRDLLAASTEG